MELNHVLAFLWGAIGWGFIGYFRYKAHYWKSEAKLWEDIVHRYERIETQRNLRIEAQRNLTHENTWVAEWRSRQHGQVEIIDFIPNHDPEF